MREVFQRLAGYSAGGGRVSDAPSEDVGRQAAGFDEHRFEEICGFDESSVLHRRFGPGHDGTHAWSHENSIPSPVVARSERAANVGENVRRTQAERIETALDRGVVFVDQREQNVTDPNVIMVVVPACLLGRAQNALGRGTEPREHRYTGLLEIGAAGFEPVTSASRTQRSTKLSYAPVIGVRDPIRTTDRSRTHTPLLLSRGRRAQGRCATRSKVENGP